MIKTGKFVWLLLIMLAVSGCATTAPETKQIFWPGFPEEPRIAYIKSLKGESDLKEKGFFDVLFGSAPDTGLGKAYGVFARDNKIYVSITAGGYVLVFDEKEKKLSGIVGDGQSKLSLPIGVAAAADGTVFVSDARKKAVFVFDSEGKLKSTIGKKDEFKNPAGIALNDTLGRLYVADSYGHSVHAFSLKGEKLFEFGKRGDGDGDFNYPTNVAVDRRNGKLYVVDTQNFRVQVFDQDGKFIRKFGELSDGFGGFSRPKGVGVDTEGHVYVVDAAFDNFQIFDEQGQLLLFIGAAGTAPGYFQLPAGMYVDEHDKVYVVDSLNHRIQVFQYLSGKWKKEHPDDYKKYTEQQPVAGQ